MAELSFRDFAGAVMGNDTTRAAEVLGVLLGLDAPAATAAATYFQKEMTAGPAFMGKAMGLRTAVTSGSDDDIAKLLGECFGITGDAVKPAVATLRKHYPAT